MAKLDMQTAGQFIIASVAVNASRMLANIEAVGSIVNMGLLGTPLFGVTIGELLAGAITFGVYSMYIKK